MVREHGVAASHLFKRRKLEREYSLTAVGAGEPVVPATLFASARAQISQLQRLLGNNTMENEILKEVVELAKERKWIAQYFPIKANRFF